MLLASLGDRGRRMTDLPLPLLMAGVALWLALAVRMAPKLNNFALFLFLALSVRYLANFFHMYTAKSVLAGQSLNSLITLTMAVGALYACRRELLRFRILLPLYAFIGILLISGLWNFEIVGMINAVIRQMLVLGLIVALIIALDAAPNEGRVSNALLAAFAAPLFYQVVSIVFRYSKDTEADGSTSYIGGYIHEGVFSTLLLTAMLIAALGGSSWGRKTLLLIILFVALLLANYRTSVVAALPLLFMHFAAGNPTQGRSGRATLTRGLTLGLMAGGATLLLGLLSERLYDIAVVVSSGSDLFKPPSEFTADERGLMSGRIMIWSNYVFATVHSDFSNLVLGFGPDSWQQSFSLYAHNVYISYIYELGLLGFAVFLLVLLHFVVLAFRAQRDKRWVLVGGHLSYLVLCSGTMPTFTIEGVLLYAMLCGYTAYYYLAPRSSTEFVVPSNARRASHRNRTSAAAAKGAGFPAQQNWDTPRRRHRSN